MTRPSGRYLMSARLKRYEPYLALRSAIFAQAVADWNDASSRTRKYVLTRYAEQPAARREEMLNLAEEHDCDWFDAAETWEFFHNGTADDLLCDVGVTAAEVWEMVLTGSWNRNHILDKPYKVAQLPTTNECKMQLDSKRYDRSTPTLNDFTLGSSTETIKRRNEDA